MKAKKLQYSTREINRDFKIKVYGYTDEGRKVEHANKQIERAYKAGQDKCICKLRRGLKVTYYAH